MNHDRRLTVTSPVRENHTPRLPPRGLFGLARRFHAGGASPPGAAESDVQHAVDFLLTREKRSLFE